MSRLFVGNLSWNTSVDSLLAAFAANGRKVREVQIVTDRDTGRSRGFAFVQMESQIDAEAAIRELDGAQLDGRPLRVDQAQERPTRGSADSRAPRRDRN